jgi:hypothetical protein
MEKAKFSNAKLKKNTRRILRIDNEERGFYRGDYLTNPSPISFPCETAGRYLNSSLDPQPCEIYFARATE